ncbi:MAG: DUF5063 domain-containing protein [Chloroflexi bacterium]|nr:MAG: DUF5063 domain-containing protein [Chloroflexota bacterium]
MTECCVGCEVLSEESIVSVEAFLLASEEYCAFIERADQIGRPELLHGVHCRLADVYAAALRLPEVRSGLPPRVENLSADASSWDKSGEIALAKQLKGLIGDVDLTKEVYGEEALPDRLSDDLASVYSELKGGLDLWSVDDQKGEILWEWSFGFIHHWAQHATSGMRLLWLLMTFGYPDPELES